EALCINCGCCVSECNAMESDPEFVGPQALAKGMRFVGDPRDGAKIERLESYNSEHGIWECTRCYFCNERCPKGVDPRDALAMLAHGHVEGEHDPYGPGSFARPYLPGENDEIPAGSDGGMGSLTQADVTPGAEPTRKPDGGA